MSDPTDEQREQAQAWADRCRSHLSDTNRFLAAEDFVEGLAARDDEVFLLKAERDRLRSEIGTHAIKMGKLNKVVEAERDEARIQVDTLTRGRDEAREADLIGIEHAAVVPTSTPPEARAAVSPTAPEVEQAVDALGKLVSILRECGCPEDEDPGLWVRRISAEAFGASMRTPESGEDDRDEHTMECQVCGEGFDMRDLDQVMAHEHDGPVLATGIRGEPVSTRTPEAERDLRAMAAVKKHLLAIDYVRRGGSGALVRVGDWQGISILATGEDVVEVIEDALAALGKDEADDGK